jgi:predicted SprT family Zn-dependent metalloprotease
MMLNVEVTYKDGMVSDAFTLSAETSASCACKAFYLQRTKRNKVMQSEASKCDLCKHILLKFSCRDWCLNDYLGER